MVASRQLEIPYYRGVGRQRERGFGALEQVIGRTAIPFLRKYTVPAAKRVCADLLEFAVPEIAEVVSGLQLPDLICSVFYSLSFSKTLKETTENILL